MSTADRPGLIGSSAHLLSTWPRRYGLGLLLVGVATLARYGLEITLGPFPPFVVFLPAIILAALFAGFGPGILATSLSTVSVACFFWTSLNVFGPSRLREAVGLLLFFVIGTAGSGLVSLYRSHEGRLREYERVVEGLKEMIVVVDREYRYLIANQSFLNYRGMKREEVIGRHVSQILDPEVFETTVKSKLEECFRGKVVQYEMRYTYPNLGERELSLTYFPLKGNGGVDRAACVLQDVTDPRKADRSLRLFRTLIDQSNDAVEVIDPETMCLLDVNEETCRALGYTRDELLAMTLDKIDPGFDERTRGRCVQELRDKQSVLKETVHRRKDGTTFPVETSLKYIQLDRSYIVAVSRDISDRKQAEETIRRAEERFRVALKDSPICVFNQDRELRYTWIYNPLPHTHKQALGKTDEEILGTKRAAALTELKRRVLETGKSVREEVTITNDGKRFVFELNVEPLFDGDGNLLGITGSKADVARLREMADRLQDATEKLAQEKSYLETEIQTELGFEDVIGQNPALRQVISKAKVVAGTDSTVLLLGETGTGKELIARSVHTLSSRRDKTFVKLNCAAVPSGLLESELFGHEKGAYTSAVSQKIGRIELADKGTLFLDEIGELPLELQPKLLRVLQDREFERLGGVHTLHVDVRIIAATNRDLQKDIAAKRFREDLYYRLHVFPIELPPLRERRDDIPKLVFHFMHKHATRMGKHIDTIPPETIHILQNWNWPGNIRELENMIERMVILTKGSVLADPPAELEFPQEFVEDSLTEVEREHIIRILRDTNGVLSGADGAASRLGLKRTTLQSMLKRFGIEPHEYRRGTGTFGRDT